MAYSRRERIAQATPPFLPGSPAEWLWQVDQSAEIAVIVNSVQEALEGSVYDAPQPRVTPFLCSSCWMTRLTRVTVTDSASATDRVDDA